MNIDVTGEARAAWRRRFAALALRRLQMPLDIPSFHDTHAERVGYVEILRSMFAEGRPDPEAMLDEAERYFSLIGPPEADRMSAGLRNQVRELQSGRYAESSLREDLGSLWEADQERLEALPSGPEKARGYLLAHVDVGRVDPDRASYEAMCFLRDEVGDEAVTEVVQGWKEAVRGVKQMVTEVLDCSEHRLFYQPFATLSLEEGDLLVKPMDNGGVLDVEAEALGNLRRYFHFEKEHHDGEGARRVVGRVLSAANAIPLRNSGGMYFVPKASATAEDASKEAGTGELPTHDATASNILAFVEQVRDRAGSAPNKTPRPSRAMSVPLVDREEYREIVAESLGEHVEKEAKALVSEMSRLLKSDTAVTERRSRRFVERVKSLKQGVSQYEELLEMRATEARTHLETAMKQAKGLLGRVQSPAEDAEGSGP